MKNLRRKIYMTAGYNTVSMGTGRKEFNPKKDRPGLEEYLKEFSASDIKYGQNKLSFDVSLTLINSFIDKDGKPIKEEPIKDGYHDHGNDAFRYFIIKYQKKCACAYQL